MTDGGTPYSTARAQPPPASPLVAPWRGWPWPPRPGWCGRPWRVRARTRAANSRQCNGGGLPAIVACAGLQSVTGRRACRARGKWVIRWGLCCMAGRAAASMRQGLGELVTTHFLINQ